MGVAGNQGRILGQGGLPRGLPRHIEQPPVIDPFAPPADEDTEVDDGQAPEGQSEAETPEDGSTPTEAPSEPQSEPLEAPAKPFDPSKHTVVEVQAYVEAAPTTLTDVWALETEGKNRATLIAWLEARTTS